MTQLPAAEVRTQLSKTKYRGGMRVLEVKPDSPASANGMQKGDVLVGLDRWETMSSDNITWIMNELAKQGPSAEGNNQIKFYLVRGQETKFGYLPMSSAPRTASLGN